MKYKVITRDWKGTYGDSPKGWVLFAGEDKISTGKDCFVTIFSKGKSTKKMSGQEIYDIHECLLRGEDVEGYDLDAKEDNILIETAAAGK